MSAHEKLEEQLEPSGPGAESNGLVNVCPNDEQGRRDHCPEQEEPGQNFMSSEIRRASLPDSNTDRVNDAIPSTRPSSSTNVSSCTTTSLQTTTMDDYLMKTLDEMEKQTEKLRETVRQVENERLYLLESLNMLTQSQALINITEGERSEVELYMDRLTHRLLTIDISVQTVRSPSQEESLRIVRALLGKLRDDIQTRDTARSQRVLQGYLNSCLEETNGPVDDRFQGALLGCTAEDQKEIKKKLAAMREANQDIDRQICILASMDLT